MWEFTQSKAALPSRSCRPCRRLATGSVSWCRQCAWCRWHWGAAQLRNPGNCCLVCELQQRRIIGLTRCYFWKASNKINKETERKTEKRHYHFHLNWSITEAINICSQSPCNSHKPISTSAFGTHHNSRDSCTTPLNKHFGFRFLYYFLPSDEWLLWEPQDEQVKCRTRSWQHITSMPSALQNKCEDKGLDSG